MSFQLLENRPARTRNKRQENGSDSQDFFFRILRNIKKWDRLPILFSPGESWFTKKWFNHAFSVLTPFYAGYISQVSAVMDVSQAVNPTIRHIRLENSTLTFIESHSFQN